jgi:hypothetical protein
MFICKLILTMFSFVAMRCTSIYTRDAEV